MTSLTWMSVPGEAGSWASLGFEVEDDSFNVGRVRLVCGAETASWGFEHIHASPEGLGVPTVQAELPSAPVTHPNGVDRIDHVVYAVQDLDEATGHLTAVLGTPPNRRFHPRGPQGPEMAFYRVGEGFIEVVASGRPPALWGIAFSSPDLDATVAAVRQAGGPIGDPTPAVQGGRIASIWKEHVGWGVAVMEPPAGPKPG